MENNLDRAIDLLDKNNKEDFRKFVNDEISFNPHNMLICKSKNLLNSYYKTYFLGWKIVKNYLVLKILKGTD